MELKLTYATMFNPPEELHTQFDAALAKVRAGLGKEYAMIINNKDVFADEKFADLSPVNTDWELAVMQKGNEKHAQQALEAARKAFPGWSHTPWQERVRLLRKAAALIEERLFELSAAMALEVGKNRMESLGDVQETADLIKYACDQMEANHGYTVEMGKDPLVGYDATNISVLRPYGVWLVVSPFNFPFALTGGPTSAALVTGNTLVIKPATDTAWIVRLLAECFRDAGLPEGVLNFVTGPGRTLGQALVTCAVDGVTFTGSFDVGAKIFRDFSTCNWVRPILLEMGGKNAVIVSRHADLERAALGIVRSAFGLQGQKCSAASRVFIEAPVYEDLTARLKTLTEKLTIGDPTDRSVYLGPVINEGAYKEFQAYCGEITAGGGKFLTGGRVRTGGLFDKGWFCEPTLAVDLPLQHRLWKHEMFLPITTIGKVMNLEEAMMHANEVNYGLTAGFYGSEEETGWFFDHIESGVAYANRPQGATTGAWPGFQPFGGWKASGSSGKNSGGQYYLPLYMHEQIQTTVR
ncbi:MAG: aldehyde dehydrogenase family protein [Chloroflexi bacterium]|nr:MAG: aldehyde dehydrogenase family protein [Chloroflexota bacterium]